MDRNDDLLSVAVRRANDQRAITIGDHATWRPMVGEYSSDTQVRVPVYSGEQKWGQIELRFAPISETRLFGYQVSARGATDRFIAATSLLVFYFYLGKMLQQLDPSRAIPQRVRAALDTMAEGLLVVDLKGRIVLANRAFATLVGADPDGLLGRKASDFPWEIESTSPGEEDAPWICALRSGESRQNDVVWLDDHQMNRRMFIVNCTPILNPGGKHGGVLISFDDVTQLEEKKVELGKAKEAAEAANRAKSEFLANMSHEIRTPMNAILGFTDVMRRGYANGVKDTHKHLNTIHSSGRHLLELVNDILDLSKVEAGKLEVERVPFKAHKTLHEAIQALSVRAQRQEHLADI